jgi:hypothetical protein
MAQIDARIPLGVQPVQIENPMNALAKVLQVQGMQQEQRVGQMKMDEYQRGVQEQNRLADLYRGGADSNALRLAGFGKQALEWDEKAAEIEQKRSSAQKNKSDAKKTDFDGEIKRIEHVSSVLSTAKDPASYQTAVQTLVQSFGPDIVKNLPQQFDPAALQATIAKGMTISQRLTDERARQQQAEAARHNQATERTAAGQLSVSQGNLGLRRQELDYSKGQGKVPSGYRQKADGTLEYIPGGPADPTAAKRNTPTEDERKAAGWLSQAMNGFANMEKAIKDDSSANRPGIVESLPLLPEGVKNMSRSDARQRFNQGASSFAEAALRAATGAGVNESEARQKIAELTPQWGDTAGNIQQKREGLKVYLDSLSTRSGRAAPSSGGATGDFSGSATPQIDDLLKKYGGK